MEREGKVIQLRRMNRGERGVKREREEGPGEGEPGGRGVDAWGGGLEQVVPPP